LKAPTERFAAYRQALAAKVHAGGIKHGKTLEALKNARLSQRQR
jgi:protein-L-isoaspartate(D-aspartate) O-methyltransferase